MKVYNFWIELYLSTEFTICEFSIKDTSEVLDVIDTLGKSSLEFKELFADCVLLDNCSDKDVLDVNNSSFILSATSWSWGSM